MGGLWSPALEGFEARKQKGPFTGGKSETIDDEWSYLPTLAGGPTWEWPSLHLDLAFGAGLLVNQAFRAPCVLSTLGAQWKTAGVLRLGARAGFLRFLSPAWLGDSDVDLSATNGATAGVSVGTSGRTSVQASLDYLWASFPADGRNGWEVSRDDLDVSGWLLQLGVARSF